MKNKRKNRIYFLIRAWKSLFNGMFVAKLRRHLLAVGFVRRFLFARAAKRPLEPRKVVFTTFSASCSCNPKYIAKALARLRPDVDIVWLFGGAEFRHTHGRAETGRAVRLWTLRAIREAATAGIWVDNAQCFLLDGMPPKREGQIYLNTWHGSLGIKRLDTADSEVQARRKKMEAVDAVLVNSDFEEGVFRGSFFPKTPFLRFGHPRNDVFFLSDGKKAAIRAKVKKTLGLPDGTHLAIYAPTFRENAFATFAKTLAFDKWADALATRFGGEWRVALRLHPHDAKAMADGLFSLPPGVLDASGYDDMQELMLAADAGITDYSSWIFDFVLGGAPGFIFAPDLAEYDQSRGFYYPLSETPFPVAETEDSLCGNIRSFDAEKYAADRAAFLAARGCMEDGRAAVRTAEWISAKLG